ncbi:MAG TPA: hypothetical protein VFN87_10130 [Solirubrobacteraceae bacterium]|nr:hypothetical protein [Solirubrobacteraceae bacterium]
MKRIPFAFAVVVTALALVLPAAASAQIVELGKTSTPVAAPSCPSGVSPAQCFIILTRTTALQTVSDGVLNPTKVKKPGWIVAFTVGLSNLSSNAKTEVSYLHTLDSAYGGTPQVALSVLKPGPKGKYTVAAESGIYHLIPFLGQVLQQPLSLPPTFSTFTALPVTPGEVVGLTVPTWAPVLSYNLSASKFAYRQSRRANCKNAAAGETAQLKVGQSTQYRCNYTGTRVEYTATEIVNQPYPKKYVHAKRRP